MPDHELDYALSPAAQRIIEDSSGAWQLLLFGQVLVDRIDSYKDAAVDSSCIEPQNVKAPGSLEDVFRGETKHIGLFIERIAAIHSRGVGEVGSFDREDASPQSIVEFAKDLALVYRDMKLWQSRVEMQYCNSIMAPVMAALAGSIEGMLIAMEQWGLDIMNKASSALQSRTEDIQIGLDLGEPDFRLVEQRLANLTHEIEGLAESSNAGFVYALYNSSMEGLVKIGKTQRDPQERARELSATTGVPTPFIVTFQQRFIDCSEAEKRVFSILEAKGLRLSNNREFFQASPAEAAHIIISVKNELEQ